MLHLDSQSWMVRAGGYLRACLSLISLTSGVITLNYMFKVLASLTDSVSKSEAKSDQGIPSLPAVLAPRAHTCTTYSHISTHVYINKEEPAHLLPELGCDVSSCLKLLTPCLAFQDGLCL